ncbi:hypothetical protein Daesc_007946 [Daldinia eschscholtzii]|uniref:C3H1-type domain-containing protein n=1 Tax=Daldinia eschscholtzii TaxID=292717 RepID=A0AAX6MGV5_9PEZI
MDTSSPLPTASGPTANSPSDLSYSSGASHTSTRNTSPDSTKATTSSQLASQLLDLGLNSDIERTQAILLNPLVKMDRNPFQSVNERRNKISTDRTLTSQSQQLQQQQQQQQQQQHFQSQTLRSNMQSLNTAPRSLVSSNWRSQAVDEAAMLTRATEFPSFDTNSGGHHLQHGSSNRHSSYTSPRLEQFPQQPQQQQQQFSSLISYPSSSTFNDLQLDGSYAYCYDRGNGQYTRLIPADMLPALKDIPPVQSSSAGMLVLPVPRGLPSNGRSSNTNPVLLRSRIDTIVASTPPTPTSLSVATGVAGLGPGSSAGAATSASVHSHSHSHHNSSGHNSQQPQQPQRRPKIYCDKWVHEGVCAFTQQGCKYKHEMPFDKVTQHQLGLFHGFPAWWKKHQADLSRQRDGTEDSVRLSSSGGGERFIGRGAGGSSSGGGGGHSGTTAMSSVAGETGGNGGMATTTASTTSSGLPSWRRGGGGEREGGGALVEQKVLGTGRSLARDVRGGVKNPFVSYSSPFGPIAPPARISTTTPAAFTTDLVGSVQTQPYQSNNHSGVGLDTGAASKTGIVGGTNTGGPNTNPYSSLSSLDENIPSKGEEEPEKSTAAASGVGSSGARLA